MIQKSSKNAKYLGLIDTIEQNKERLPDLKVCEGVIYKRVKFYRDDIESEEECWRIWVPEELTKNIIQKSHEEDTSHGGIAKSLHNIRKFFYWPVMTTHIKEFINNCDTCKEIKHPKQILRPPMGNEVITQRPFQKNLRRFFRAISAYKIWECIYLYCFRP